MAAKEKTTNAHPGLISNCACDSEGRVIAVDGVEISPRLPRLHRQIPEKFDIYGFLPSQD